jgi:hypothetical protein
MASPRTGVKDDPATKLRDALGAVVVKNMASASPPANYASSERLAVSRRRKSLTLKGQGAALRAEFDQLPQTIGRSITNLSTAWTQHVGET